jgi:type VI secretion system lysozyme-like protein
MSFLHRLASLPTEPLLASITRNLCVVLNTRKGCGSVIESFGLGDYEAHPNTIEAVSALTGEIAALVRRYEPRLASPEVRLLGREGTSRVCFALTGMVAGQPAVFHVVIHSEYRNVIVSLA